MPPPGFEPLLCAICANPEEDTARLVYADWLDEHGDHARAEFVRLQVALAPYPRQYNEDHFRTEALLKAHGKTWLAELPELSGVTWADEFRRGFVAGARASRLLALLAHRKALFAATPVQVLTVDWVDGRELLRLLALAELNRLTELYLPACRVPLGKLAALAECRNLGRLRTFGMRGRTAIYQPALSLSEAKALAASPHLPELRELYFTGSLPVEAIEVLRARFETVRFLGTTHG